MLKERGSLCAPEIALQPAVLGLRPRLRHVCAVWVRGAGGPPDDSPNSEKVTGGAGKPPFMTQVLGPLLPGPGDTGGPTEAPPRPAGLTAGKLPERGQSRCRPGGGQMRTPCEQSHPGLRVPVLQEPKALCFFPSGSPSAPVVLVFVH